MISEEQAKLIRKFEEIKNAGYYCNSNQVQSVYNQVFDRNLPATHCGTCIRKRITEMVRALNAQEEQQRKQKEEEEKKQAAIEVLEVLDELSKAEKEAQKKSTTKKKTTTKKKK